MLKPTVIAIPVFALLIAIETYFSVSREENYDRKDVWTNIALGFGSVAFGVELGVLFRVDGPRHSGRSMPYGCSTGS